MAKKSSQEIADERAAARAAAGNSEDGVRLIEAADGKPVRCDNPGVPPSSIEQTGPVLVGKPRKPMPKTDPELQAMARIDRILAELDGNQKRRVVDWIRDRFGPQPHFGSYCPVEAGFPGGSADGPSSARESTR